MPARVRLTCDAESSCSSLKSLGQGSQPEHGEELPTQAIPTHLMCCATDPSASYEHAASGVLSGHFTYRHRDHEAALTRSVLRGFPGMARANAGVTPPAPLSMSMASMTRWRSRSGAEPALALIVAILQHRIHTLWLQLPCVVLTIHVIREQVLFLPMWCVSAGSQWPLLLFSRYCVKPVMFANSLALRSGRRCLTFTTAIPAYLKAVAT